MLSAESTWSSTTNTRRDVFGKADFAWVEKAAGGLIKPPWNIILTFPLHNFVFIETRNFLLIEIASKPKQAKTDSSRRPI